MLPTMIRRRQGFADPFEAVRREMENFFPTMPAWMEEGAKDVTAAYPVDVHEDEQCVYVDAEMPGFTREEVNVTLEKGVLHLVAEHREEPKQPRKVKEHLKERRYTRVERAFTLPVPVDEGKVEAKLENGVLKVRLHKAKEAMKQRIMIQ